MFVNRSYNHNGPAILLEGTPEEIADLLTCASHGVAGQRSESAGVREAAQRLSRSYAAYADNCLAAAREIESNPAYKAVYEARNAPPSLCSCGKPSLDNHPGAPCAECRAEIEASDDARQRARQAQIDAEPWPVF